MSLATVFFILVIVIMVLYLVYKYCPHPVKNPLLALLAIAATVWVLQILGFFAWLQSKSL